MQNPLQMIQTFSQNLLSGKAAVGKGQAGLADAAAGEEQAPFSNVLNQAIQQQGTAEKPMATELQAEAKAATTELPAEASDELVSKDAEEAATPPAALAMLAASSVLLPIQPVAVDLSVKAADATPLSEVADTEVAVQPEKSLDKAILPGTDPVAKKKQSGQSDALQDAAALSPNPDSVANTLQLSTQGLAILAAQTFTQPVQNPVIATQSTENQSMPVTDAVTPATSQILNAGPQGIALAQSIALPMAQGAIPQAGFEAQLQAAEIDVANLAPNSIPVEPTAPQAGELTTASDSVSSSLDNSLMGPLPEVQADSVQPNASTGLPSSNDVSNVTVMTEAAQSVFGQAQPTPTGKSDKAGKPAIDSLKTITKLGETLQSLKGSVEASPFNDEVEAVGDTSEMAGAEAAEFAELLPSDMEATDAQAGVSDSADFNPLASQGAVSNASSQTTFANTVAQFSSTAASPADQVADGTVHSIKTNQKELVLRLNPDNLGEVKINLVSNGKNELSARFIASTPEGHEALKNQLDTLKSTLEAQGVHVERMSVVLAGSVDSSHHAGDQSQNFQQPNSQQQQQSASQQFQHQGQPDSNAFAQMAGQFQQQKQNGYVSTPGSSHANRQGESVDGVSADNLGRAENNSHRTRDDDGRVSVLA